MSFDAVIAGGGVVGACIASRLAEKGLNVLVVDPQEPHRDASWAAAGMLCAQAEAAEPGPFLDLLLAAEDRWAELADRFDYQRQGVLHVALSQEERAQLLRQQDWQSARGLPVDFLEPAEVEELEPGLARVVGALFLRRGGQIDNRALAPAFLEEARRRGAVVRRGRIEGLVVEAGKLRAMVLAGQRIEAQAAVIAAGAWSSQIAGLGLAVDAVVPVRGELLAYSATPPPVSRAVFGAGGYVLPKHGRLCLVGTTMERVGFDAGVTEVGADVLQLRARKLCPSLEGLPIAEQWAGLRPATADGLPALGPTPIEGLHLAVGLFRNGILLAPLAADLVMRAMFGDDAAIPSPFAAKRLFA